MFSLKTVLCCFGIITFAHLVHLNQAQTIQSSVELLTPRDTSIGLNCFIGKSKVNNYTTVRFTVQGKEVYNSKTNFKASGVTVLNQTSISYSKISAGLVQAECFINTTKSTNSLTVSSFKSLTQKIILEGGVSRATIGQNVTQTCTQVTVPNVQQYELNFLKDSTVIAQWKVDGQKRTFSVPNKVDGLQVSQGNASSATTFSSVSLLPTSAKANGVYKCQFVFENYKTASGDWHGNFAPPAPPTTTTKMPSTIVPTTPTKKPMTTTTRKPMTTTTKMPMTTTTKKPMTTTTKKPMTTPTPSTSTTMKPTTKMMSTTTKAPPPMTTETPKQTTTTSKSEPTKPETTTTSHHHHHSTTPKNHHPTTTSKPKGAATSIQTSLLASFFALFVFLFAH